MGTKRELVGHVASVVRLAREGIFLDAFSGMCSVGEEIGTDRQIWSNDTQWFAAQVAHALFACREAPISTLTASEKLFPCFARHQSYISHFLQRSLEAESKYMTSTDLDDCEGAHRNIGRALETETPGLANRKYVLFSKLYSDTYIGISQAIEIDSIVASIGSATRSRAIGGDQKRWLLIALGRAVLKCSSTTGHFAQFLRPKKSSRRVFLAQRRRGIWAEWLQSISVLSPVGSQSWRSRNRVFNQDSVSLMRTLKDTKMRPGVVYADPPYTDDQYSRYYHLLDTLLLYDYPKVTGKGRYRHRRFRTPFSMRTTVVEAFDGLISGVAAMKADLILSYPSSGLLQEVGTSPMPLLKKHFKHVECKSTIPHKHSTMGASKGPVTDSVTEFIYLARV
jgi:adenine-specific DNA-methyltransferase